MVPLAAVIPLESGHEVYIEQDSTAQPRSVKLGLIQGLLVQVEEGLSAGDRLIVAGHRLVGPGQSIKVVADEGSGAASGSGAPAQ
jgi:hypothetical protein